MTRFNNYDLPGMPPVLAWNPIVMRCPGGCEVGDDNCWHLRMCHRQGFNPTIPQWKRDIRSGKDKTPRWDLQEKRAPIERRKPAVIAPMFMGEIGQLPRHMIMEIAVVAEWARRHVFLILTKYPQALAGIPWPENCWVGVSVCNQAGADERLPALMGLDCRHRWVSVEPMLGVVDLRRWLLSEHDKASLETQYLERLGGNSRAKLEFVAAGPETGPLARPCDADWLVNLRDECEECRVPFYDKREGGAREWPQAWKTALGYVQADGGRAP